MAADYSMLAWLSTWHIVLLVVIVLLLFGGKKLPELARGVGKGMRIFRDELHGIQKEIEEPEEPPVKAAKTEKPAQIEQKQA